MKKGDWLKVLERHKVLTLAREKRITQRQAAQELGLSLPHTKRLLRRLRQAGGDAHCLDYQRHHAAPNRIPEEVRAQVVAVKRQSPGRSNPLIAQLLWEQAGQLLHPSTVRRILVEKGEYTRSHFRRPCRRFEREAFGELVQMDTSSGAWLEGYRRVYLVLVLDDYSRAILAARFFDADSTYNNMRVLREAIEHYGVPCLLYSDNDSKFKLIRYPGSRFYTYREETLAGETITEIHRALLELGCTLLTHEPGNAQAKGKIERLFRFIQGRFLPEHTASTLEELNAQFQRWIIWYNHEHLNRDIGCVPLARVSPTAFKLLNGLNLDDVLCLKEERKVGKDNSFSLDGMTYAIPREHNMVARKVQLHIHPGRKIRVWHKDQCLCQLSYQEPKAKAVAFFDGPRPGGIILPAQ